MNLALPAFLLLMSVEVYVRCVHFSTVHILQDDAAVLPTSNHTNSPIHASAGLGESSKPALMAQASTAEVMSEVWYYLFCSFIFIFLDNHGFCLFVRFLLFFFFLNCVFVLVSVLRSLHSEYENLLPVKCLVAGPVLKSRYFQYWDVWPYCMLSTSSIWLVSIPLGLYICVCAACFSEPDHVQYGGRAAGKEPGNGIWNLVCSSLGHGWLGNGVQCGWPCK